MWRHLALTSTLAIGAVLVACGESNSPPPPPAPATQPARDYQAEAKKAIDQSNMAGELDKLDKEIKTPDQPVQ